MDFGDVQHWIEGFSYPAVLLLLISAGLGAPVSEELIMIAGGLVVGKTGGSLPAMILTAYVGVLVGDSLLWRIGNRLGPRAVGSRWVKKILTPARVGWAQRHFDRYGAFTIFVVRFCIGLRAVTFLTAGTSGLRYRRFLLADAAAAAIYVPILVWLGHHFGAAVLDDVQSAFHWILGAVIALVVVLSIVSMVRRRRRLRQPAVTDPSELHV